MKASEAKVGDIIVSIEGFNFNAWLKIEHGQCVLLCGYSGPKAAGSVTAAVDMDFEYKVVGNIREVSREFWTNLR